MLGIVYILKLKAKLASKLTEVKLRKPQKAL